MSVIIFDPGLVGDDDVSLIICFQHKTLVPAAADVTIMFVTDDVYISVFLRKHCNPYLLISGLIRKYSNGTMTMSTIIVGMM